MDFDDEIGGSEDLGIYVYHPTTDGERSSKRRKVSTSNEHKSHRKDQSQVFVPLLGGKEPSELVDGRKATFKELWSSQEERCKKVIEELDSGILEEITSFVKTASPEAYGGCIPTSLVTIGSNVSALPRLLDILHRRLTTEKSGQVVLLESGDAPNLKAVLKTIIRTAVTSTSGNDAYQNLFNDKSGPRMLPYDLNVLYQYVLSQGSKSLVLAFRDSEAFDFGVLNDLLSLLSSWVDRIPLVLLFGISTSVELFEGRLPRSIVALLHGKQFEIHEAEGAIDRIYETLQTGSDTKLWLGPHLSTSLIEKARDHFQSPEGFIREVKYAYMSHFFANPLSILLSSSSSKQKELCEAIRNLKSFRSFCEQLIEEGEVESVRALLLDDEALWKQVLESVENGLTRMKELFNTMNILRSLQTTLQLTRSNSNTDMYIRGVSGDLSNSVTIKDLLSRLQKIDSDSLARILTILREHGDTPAPFVDVNQYEQELQTLLATQGTDETLRSKHDDQNTSIKTTIIKDKVNLTKTKKNISDVESAYTELLQKIIEELETSLTSKLINPQDLFLHEVFVFDLRNPLRDTFAPRARFCIERALSTPFDYLANTSSEHGGGEGGNLSAQQPETALLYQLYLESGSLVNVFDLWKAFSTIVCGDDQETERDERSALMLFYRAMSELKTLGMMKPSRKKVDHVSKSAWKGL
ncbi:hypothetical protein TCE0_033r09783 [Talaromyces pinophilus]|uniref:Uncharacterized protein n=1 Tax=Talaromyces pinophilus TaxID=128442 RepID=A0A6V8HKB3_TALPI|nr:hypothetical protein TCE0_033r09783 [Talaromyces pinophilus]